MANAFTSADAVLLYYTEGDESLGGRRTTPVQTLQICHLESAMPPVVIESVSPSNPRGVGYIAATDASTLAWTPPGAASNTVIGSDGLDYKCIADHTSASANKPSSGDDWDDYWEYAGTQGRGQAWVTSTAYTAAVAQGDGVAVAANNAALLESGDDNQSVRVYRDSDYDSEDFEGRMAVHLEYASNTLVPDVDSAFQVTGGYRYRGFIIWNASGKPVSSLKVYNTRFGNTITTDSAQLSASGAGTITTTGTIDDDVPQAGYAEIRTSGDSIREIVYYSSRTSTSLTVPSAGRGMCGTTAAAGASDDTINFVSGLSIGGEAVDDNGEIQTTADNETAPSSVTYGNQSKSSETGSAPLSPNRAIGVWLRHDIPAGMAFGTNYPVGITMEYSYDGTTYTQEYRGCYNVADATQDTELFFVGEDTAADPTGSADDSGSSLPLEVSVSLPMSGTKVINGILKTRNEYGLVSLNQYQRSVEIDTSGDEVTPALESPVSVSVSNDVGGYMRYRASYLRGLDSDPADTWNLYITTDGTDPDPSTDTPTQVEMDGGNGISNTRELNYTAGPYNYGATVKAIIRVERSSDSAESSNEDIVSATVSTSGPAPVGDPLLGLGTTAARRANSRPLAEVTTIDAGTSTTITQYIGETVYAIGATVVLRCTWDSDDIARVWYPNDWRLAQDTSSLGSGTSDAVEVVSATEQYICVAGTRRVKIDATAKTITAAQFDFPGSITGVPVSDASLTLDDRTVFQVFHGKTGAPQTFMEVDSSGILTMSVPVSQRIN